MKRLKTTDNVSLTLPNSMQLLPAGIALIEEVCQAHGFDDSTTQTINMACEEAIANVIQHAFDANDLQSLTLHLKPLPTGIEITIADKGLPYDPNEITFDVDTLSGLGNYVIGKLMDKVSYNNLGKAGKALALTKYFPNADDFDPTVDTQVDTNTVANTEYTYTYRLFEPKDAIEIARCAYESYGYTYSYEHIYFPERVRALNQSGDLISIVAVANTGEVAGHVGLVKFDGAKGLYEVGLAMTKQKFRGGNIFSNLMNLAMQEAESRKFTALYGQCVTTHTYSQGQPTKIGMLPTALLPAYVPDDVSFKKIADATPKRTAILIVTKLLKESMFTDVYIPQKYINIAEHVYNQYGKEKTLVTTVENPPIAEFSSSKLDFSTYLKMGKLFLYNYGEDFKLHLKKHIQQIKKEQIQMIEAFVNINKPDALKIIDEAEQMGFVFTGILPGAEDGDLAILQYLNGSDTHLDAIKVIDLGQPLLKFINAQFN